MNADLALRRLARTRHGVVTRVDARGAGLSDRQLRIRVSRGEWEPRGRRVFVLGGSPDTPQQRLLVAALRADGVASHRSAAWLHGLVDRAPTRPEVARAARRGDHLEQIVVHRIEDLTSRDCQHVDGIPSTTATRTVIDLAADCGDAEFRRLLDRALRHGRTHPDALITRFASLARRGRPGVRRLRAALQELDSDLCLLESDLESMLFELLRTAGLPMPQPQFEVMVGGVAYRLDLAYPDVRVAIEGDGFAFHSDRDVFEIDRERQNALVLAGWTVLRFTWRQICSTPEWVAAQVRQALELAVAPSLDSRALR